MSEKRVSSNTGRLPGLDGIRGLAILGVLLYHLMPHVFPGGFLGVNLFLVLSGFLINRSLEKEYYLNRKISPLSFMSRRLGKLFTPLFWMVVIVASFLFIFQKQLLTNYLGEAISGVFFFNNWWQLSMGSSYFMKFITPSTLTHLWYLSIQVQFYIIWLVVFVVIRSISLKKKTNYAPTVYLVITMVSAILMGVLFKTGQDPTRVYYGVDTRIFSFSFGALISLYVKNWKSELYKKMPDHRSYLSRGERARANRANDPARRRKAKLKPFGLVSLVIIIIMMIYTQDNSPFTFRGGMFLYSFLSAVLIFAAVNPRMMVSRILDSEIVLNWLGKRSYSLYLWHYPVIIIYQVMSKGKQISGVMSLVIQLGLIIILTNLSYYIFEKNYLMIPVYQFEGLERERIKFKMTWFDKRKKRVVQKASFVFLSAMLLITSFGLATYKGDNKIAQDLQKKIEDNQKAIADKKGQKAERTESDDSKKENQNEAVQNVDGLTPEEAKFAGNLDVTFIGDSMLLMAVSPIESIFPKAEIDGAVGRQLYQSSPVVENLMSQGRLKDTVVIILGANGSFTSSQFDSFAKTIGNDKKIFLVTTNAETEWKESVNQSFIEKSKANKNMYLVDWNSHMAGHADWLEPDGTHPNITGSEEMIKLIAKEIYKVSK